MSVCGESMTTSGGAGTTLPSANSSTFPDVLGAPASLIGSELSVYLAPAFIMPLAALFGPPSLARPSLYPAPMLQGLSYVHQDHEPTKPVHKKHNTRRCGHPSSGAPGQWGWGYADFHALCSRAHTFASQTNMV